jgi:HEAT repeat protein
MQSRQDMHGLIQALRYPDPEVRGRAAVALRTLDAAPAVPAIKAALRDELDEQTRRYLNEALNILDKRTDVGLLAQNADLDGLVAALKSPRSETVIEATKALSQLGNRLAVEPLIILFHNSTSPPAVRLAAAEALLELKSAPAVVTLLGALQRDSWQVRRNAAAVLGQLQAIWAVEPLAEALKDPHPVVRRSAAAALKRIGTPEAITAIRNAVWGKLTSPAQAGDSSPQEAESNSSTDEVKSSSHEAQPRLDSTPPKQEQAPSEPSSKSSENAPRPEFGKLSETEQGETSESHETRPSESTRPTVRVHKPLQRSVDPRAETIEREPAKSSSSGESDESAETGAENQTRGPVARVIAFLRRHGSSSSR